MLGIGDIKDYPAPAPEDTLRLMGEVARAAQLDANLRLLWERIVAGLRQKDYISEFAAVLCWVRQNVRYSKDPLTIEQVKSPSRTISTKTGDCDDQAVLIASLVSLGGARTRFRAGAFLRSGVLGRPMLAHVWAEAFDPGTQAWIVLDPVPEKRVNEMLGRVIHSIAADAVY
jgi:transglutaminase-like putative cysteine protease